jgi:TrmH family RNA methyltransferase
MVTKAKVKLIESLELKRNRQESGLFVAEGDKVVTDLLESELEVDEVFCTSDWHAEHEELVHRTVVEIVRDDDMRKLSLLTTSTPVTAIAHIPHRSASDIIAQGGFILALDRIQDPGNVGTIIRTAEWFGFNVICGEGCADPYSPKVVQAAMGALFRVKVASGNLLEMLSASPSVVYATALNGDELYKTDLPDQGVVLIGNESQGISEELLRMASKHLTIPSAASRKTMAGLNAAVAAALVMAEFTRAGSQA